MKWYCSNCGLEFESNVAECPKCGETYDLTPEEDYENEEA